MRAGRAAAGLLATLFLGAGCATPALLQTAKPTPPGEIRMAIGAGYLHNSLVKERGNVLNNVPLQFNVRFGLVDHLDVGLSSMLGFGTLLDFKYDFMPPDSRFGLALLAGLGGAAPGSGGGALHVPVMAIASVKLFGRLTPYVAGGYGAWWIFYNPSSEDGRPLPKSVPRDGWGDGVVQVRGGLEIELTERVALLVEYDYETQVVDDRGDNFDFVDNHRFLAGVRF